MNRRSALLLKNTLALTVCWWISTVARSQESTTENIWISSVAWTSPTELVATQSQGLLLRPGKVVQLTSADPSKLNVIGQAETSLWSCLKLNQAIIVSDYKGQLIKLQDGASQPIALTDARWIRAITRVPQSDTEIVIGTEDGKLIVVNAADGTELRRVEAGSAAIFEIAFNPQATQLAVAMGDGQVKLLSWPAMESQAMIKSTGVIWSCLYTADGTGLLTGGADRKIRLWDVATAQPIVAVASARDWVTSMQLLPDSSLVLAGCMDGQVLLVDTATKLPVKSVKLADSGIWDMALSPDGINLAMATRKHGVVITNVHSWPEEAITVAQQAAAEQPPQPPQ